MIPYEEILRERTDTNYGLSIIRKTIITRFFAGVHMHMSIDTYRLYLKDYPDDPFPGHAFLQQIDYSMKHPIDDFSGDTMCTIPV